MDPFSVDSDLDHRGLLGNLLGVIAGWKPGKLFDKIMTPILLVVNTIPSNCLCLILLIFFAYRMKLFPINGMVSPGVEGMARVQSILQHMFLPLIIMILLPDLGDFMLMKSASQVRSEEYIMTAESKGLPSKSVVPPCDEKCHGSLCHLFLAQFGEFCPVL